MCWNNISRTNLKQSFFEYSTWILDHSIFMKLINIRENLLIQKYLPKNHPWYLYWQLDIFEIRKELFCKSFIKQAIMIAKSKIKHNHQLSQKNQLLWTCKHAFKTKIEPLLNTQHWIQSSSLWHYFRPNLKVHWESL